MTDYTTDELELSDAEKFVKKFDMKISDADRYIERNDCGLYVVVCESLYPNEIDKCRRIEENL